ncbi:hypothetical protein Tco_1264988 [Tanacetum coccineum]
MNLVTTLSDRIRVLEADLLKTKKTYSSAYTKLILRVKKLESQIKIGKAGKYTRVVISDDEAFGDDSSKQGRKFSDEEVQEKASTDTELFIQEVTPTEVIQDQEAVWKASDEVSTGFKVYAKAINLKIIGIGPKSSNRLLEMRRLLDSGMRRKEKELLMQLKKSPEKVVEEESETQEELKECVKEPAAKRKKSIPRKTTRKRQKLEEDAENNGLAIHMLTEKKYPLSQEMMTKMLSRKLEVDHESSQAFELIRFLRSQVKK